MKSNMFLLLIVIMPFNAGAYVYGGSNLGYLIYPSHGYHKPTKPRKPYSFSSQWEEIMANKKLSCSLNQNKSGWDLNKVVGNAHQCILHTKQNAVDRAHLQ